MARSIIYIEDIEKTADNEAAVRISIDLTGEGKDQEGGIKSKDLTIAQTAATMIKKDSDELIRQAHNRYKITHVVSELFGALFSECENDCDHCKNKDSNETA